MQMAQSIPHGAISVVLNGFFVLYGDSWLLLFYYLGNDGGTLGAELHHLLGEIIPRNFCTHTTPRSVKT